MIRTLLATAGWCLLSSVLRSAAQGNGEISVIPVPSVVEPRQGAFGLGSDTKIRVIGVSDDLKRVGEQLCARLRTATGFAIPMIRGGEAEGQRREIVLKTDDRTARLGDEGYTLDVETGQIIIAGLKPAGVFYGVQTLYQLLPPEVEKQGPTPGISWTIPCVRIEDRPRFRWRGMHLDVGRHFFPKEFVEKYIDLMAMYKLNRFHWHLTEDQGWRIEIKKYPKLTEIGSRRARTADDTTCYEGFYTQDEVREVVEYARQRFIAVVPEIEMPGHSQAALASYPELSCTGGPFAVGTLWGVIEDVYCAGNDRTFEFLEGVLDEVMQMFPGEVIHIGGDECPKVRWKACPKCQARIRAEGLKNEEELQSYFIRRIEKYLNSKGRRIIGWDEILEGGLAPNATVMSWRGIAGGIEAARAGHDVIMTPTSHCYFDYHQGKSGEPAAIGDYLPIDTVYSYEPVPSMLSPEEAQHVLGSQGNMWTEYMPNTRHVEYMLMPRMCALSEVVWSPASKRNFEDFSRRLESHYDRLAYRDVNFRVPPPVGTGGSVIITGDTIIALTSPVSTAEIRYTLNGPIPGTDSPLYTGPLRITGNATVSALTVLRNGRMSHAVTTVYSHIDPKSNGIGYEYYEGVWDSIPDLGSLTPVKSGVVYDIGLDVVPHRGEFYALRFTGSITLADEGTYVFYTNSDDGSTLSIDGRRVVDNNGLHGAREAGGKVALAAGRHALEVEYFQKGGGQSLEALYEGPGISKQHIPPHILFRR